MSAVVRQLQPGSLRMRRTRERRKEGALLASVEISEDAIEMLVGAGLLDASYADDKQHVGRAVERLLTLMLRATYPAPQTCNRQPTE